MVVVELVVVLNTEGMLLVGALFSGLEEEEQELSCSEVKTGLDTLFFRACKRSALGFPERQESRGWRERTGFHDKVYRTDNHAGPYMLNYSRSNRTSNLATPPCQNRERLV